MTHSTSRPDYTTIILAYLGFLALGLGTVLGLAWPSMQTEFAVSLADQGVLSLASTAGALVASFYSGTLTYRFGVGRLLVLSAAISAIMLIAVAFTHTWPVLVFIMLISGLGVGAIDAGINSYAAHHFSERVMNWLHASFGIGVTLTPLMMTAIFSAHLSWRIGYVVAGVVMGVVAICFLLTQSRWLSPVAVQENSAAPASRVSMRQTLRLPIVWISIAMLFLCAGLEATPGNWIFTVFTKGRGIPEVEAAQWVSIYWGSFTVARIFFGIIISRVNSTTLLRVVMLIGIIGAALLWWNAAPWVGVAGLMLVGFSLAPIYPVMTSNTPRRVGIDNAANAVGFQVAGAGAGLALLPALSGVLAHLTNLEIILPIVLFAYILMFALFQLSQVYSGRTASIAQPAMET